MHCGDQRHAGLCLGIGFKHGVLGLTENPARGTGFWSQNTEGVARGVLTEKARPDVLAWQNGHQHAIIGNPARAVGECRNVAKAQP